MPDAWTKKDERQYEHVRRSERQKGRSKKRAKTIAAATVNKTRRKQGKTPNKQTQGTGNPGTRLEDRTVNELRNRAKELGIEGRSSMDKQHLVSAIRNAR